MDIHGLLGYCVGMEGLERVEGIKFDSWGEIIQKGITKKNNPELYIVGFGDEFQKDGLYRETVASVCRGPLEKIDLTHATGRGAGYLDVHLKTSRYAARFVDGCPLKDISKGHTFTLREPYEEPVEFYLSSDKAVKALSNKGLQKSEISEMMDFLSEEES